MKKFLSIFMILVMLLTSVTLLASCSKVSEDDMEDDPYEVLNNAMDQSLNAFFSDEAGVNNVLKKASEKGKYKISFESDELMGGEITKITEIIYSDKKNNQFVSETDIVYNGEKLSAKLFGNGESIALQSNSIFGSNIAILFDPETFARSFPNSAMAELMELTYEDSREIVDMMNKLFNEEMLDAEKREEYTKELYEDLINMMDQSVSTEKMENYDGKETEYIVTTYSIDNKSVKKMVERLYEYVLDMSELYELSGEYDIDEIQAEFDELILQIEEKTDIDIEIDIYVEAKTGNLYMFEVDGDVEVVEDRYDYYYDEYTGEVDTVFTHSDTVYSSIKAEMMFTDDLITFEAKITSNEETVKIDADIEKEVDDGDVTYELSVKVGTDSVNINLINASYEYEEDGDITIKINIPKEVAGEAIRIVITGSLEVSKDEVELTFDSLKVGDEKFKFKLVLSAEAVDSIPEFPEDAEDIVDLSKADWEELIDKIENSDFVKFIGSIGGSNYPDDNYPSYPMPDEEETIAEDVEDEYSYSTGYSNGYADGTYAGERDVSYGLDYEKFEVDYYLYYNDMYYQGYCDGYINGYDEAYNNQ